MAVLSCTPAQPIAPSPAPGLLETTGVPYPRSAAVYLDQHDLPPVADLARYDILVIDHEWAHRAHSGFFSDLRAANPSQLLLAYVNFVDHPDSLGSPEYWPGRYDLWQFTDPSNSTFPTEWFAGTANGGTVSQWPGTTMVNLADTGPRVDGRTFSEYAADWIERSVWSTGVWDGIFLDVWSNRIYNADHDRWDVDRDGVDETDDEIYGPGGPWDRGLRRTEAMIHERLPDAVLIGNSDRNTDDSVLNGRAWESFADADVGRTPSRDIAEYLRLSSESKVREPAASLTINKRRVRSTTSDEYRRARFFLTATLLGDGYWAAAGRDYSSLEYYDEMDGGGLGAGYLGYPLNAELPHARVRAPLAEDPDVGGRGVYRRDFENGIVLVNTGSQELAVPLEHPFRHLDGDQDPVVNDGSVTVSVTVPAGDGVILLRTNDDR